MWKLLLVLMLIPAFLTGQTKKSNIPVVLENYRNKIEALRKSENAVMNELIDINLKVEEKLQKLIKHLTAGRDSGETGTLIIRNKKKIIKDLQKAQKEYQVQRDSIDKEFKTDVKFIDLDIDSLKGWMDEKINTRIKQITSVTDSLSHYREYYDGNLRNQYNDRRNVKTADREKNKVIKKFSDELAGLNEKVKKIDDNYYESSRLEKETSYNQMQALTERATLLEHSIEDILNGGKDGRKIGKIAGLRLDREIRKSTSEIQGYLKSFLYGLRNYKKVLSQREKASDELERLTKASTK